MVYTSEHHFADVCPFCEADKLALEPLTQVLVCPSCNRRYIIEVDESEVALAVEEALAEVRGIIDAEAVGIPADLYELADTVLEPYCLAGFCDDGTAGTTYNRRSSWPGDAVEATLEAVNLAIQTTIYPWISPYAR